MATIIITAADTSNPGQNSQSQREATAIPSFSEILGKSPQWAEENIGRFSDSSKLKEWLERKAPPAQQAVGTAFHIFLPNSKGRLETNSLEITITRIAGRSPIITAVKWGMAPRQSFDEAFVRAKLNLMDFEFVSEKTITYGWDVTTLRRKDKPSMILELTRTESNYSILLRLDLDALIRDRAGQASPL